MPCETIDGSANSIIVKVATIDDLDDLTKIAQAGFPDDPEFDYRFPRRRKYPEDNWLWTRKEYEGYLNQPDKYAVLLATLPANESGEQNGDHKQGPDLNRSQPISVALAVWDTAVTIDSQVGDLGIDERRDADRRHMLEFANTLSDAFEKHFAKYAGNQLHLWLLTTHPDYRHRGAGTALCRWGMQLAQQKGQPVTVLASSMGQMLYEHLCFQTLGKVVVQAPGEEDQLHIACLEWQPKQFGRGACTIL
ncbi:hypothetical protein E8E14_012994 [Neopestalotiopsis sp. 37M]|nr:hypothetical protein E8E14_012994 [Neopestalotiopsis sp. 37M]